MSKSVKRRARISISSSDKGSRVAPAARIPLGGPGEVVLVGQQVKDNDPVPVPAGEGLRALSVRIMELISAVMVVLVRLGEEEQAAYPKMEQAGLDSLVLENLFALAQEMSMGGPSLRHGGAPLPVSDVAYRGTSPGAAVLIWDSFSWLRRPLPCRPPLLWTQRQVFDVFDGAGPTVTDDAPQRGSVPPSARSQGLTPVELPAAPPTGGPGQHLPGLMAVGFEVPGWRRAGHAT
ncbi:unnamed protein product [Lampetra fluviatilis]